MFCSGVRWVGGGGGSNTHKTSRFLYRKAAFGPQVFCVVCWHGLRWKWSGLLVGIGVFLLHPLRCCSTMDFTARSTEVHFYHSTHCHFSPYMSDPSGINSLSAPSNFPSGSSEKCQRLAWTAKGHSEVDGDSAFLSQSFTAQTHATSPFYLMADRHMGADGISIAFIISLGFASPLR